MKKEELRAIYGTPSERAIKKLMDHLDPHAELFISKSPFVVISSFDSEGNVDTSPRGGDKGFVKVIHPQKIIIPDFKGNNRIDSLTNISQSGKIGMLFLIPGMDETLRLNGNATISSNKEYLDLYTQESHPPKTVIEVELKEVFLHCAKAFMRSKLWSQESQIDRNEMPTMGQMLKDQLKSDAPAESHEAMVERYKKDL